MNDREPPFCYVCTEETAPLMSGICMCVDRYIHPECQDTLIARISKNGQCSVCKTLYKNVNVTKHKRLNNIYCLLCVTECYTHFISLCLVFMIYLNNKTTHLIPIHTVWCLNFNNIHKNYNKTYAYEDYKDTCIDVGQAVSILITVFLSSLVLCMLCLSVMLLNKRKKTASHLETTCVMRTSTVEEFCQPGV